MRFKEDNNYFGLSQNTIIISISMGWNNTRLYNILGF